MGLERSVVALDNVGDGRWSWLATGIVPSVGDICIGGLGPCCSQPIPTICLTLPGRSDYSRSLRSRRLI